MTDIPSRDEIAIGPFEELVQNGARREAIPDPPEGARRTLCTPLNIGQNFPFLRRGNGVPN